MDIIETPFFRVLHEDFVIDPNDTHILYIDTENIMLRICINDDARMDLAFRLMRYFLYD